MPDDKDNHLIDNSLLYFHSRSSLEDGYLNYRKDNQDRWPSYTIENSKKTLKAIASMRPGEKHESRMTLSETNIVQEKMVDLVQQMSDSCCDVWDIAVAKYIKFAQSPTDMLPITASEILKERGMPLRAEYKLSVARDIEILSNLWINVMEMERIETYEDRNGKKRTRKAKWRGRSKALVVTSEFGRVKPDNDIVPMKWMYRPGDIYSSFLLSEAKTFSILSSKVLEYHATRDVMLKRIGRYLSYSWRCRAYRGAYTLPIKLDTLLRAAKIVNGCESPKRTLERFEKALDRLTGDGIVGAWQWHPEDYDLFVFDKRKGWWDRVLQWRCILEPPQTVLDQYQKIQCQEPSVIEPPDSNFAAKLKIARLTCEISQSRLAEILEVTPLYVSYLERGVRSPGPKLRARIEKWMKK